MAQAAERAKLKHGAINSMPLTAENDSSTGTIAVASSAVLCPRAVTILFVRAQSIYKLLPCDCYDRRRDARQYVGNAPVIAHPPCRTWGNLRTVATKAPADEHALGPWAIAQVRRCGGVLEHPAGSTLFAHENCGTQERPDKWGGYTIEVNQFDWGHRCSKPTKLYIVGCVDLPAMPKREGQPTHCITQGHGVRIGHPLFKSRVPQWEREATPPALAKWLVELASRCRGHNGELCHGAASGAPNSNPPASAPLA